MEVLKAVDILQGKIKCYIKFAPFSCRLKDDPTQVKTTLFECY